MRTLLISGLTAILLIVYSYSQIDLNLTLTNADWWPAAREALVHFGYYQRFQSSLVYLGFVLALFILHFFWVKNYKKINILMVLIPIGIIGLLSYPLLSHDLFNYMFDARIVTYYQQNPYLMKPLDFEPFGDTWLRFMHWTHRTYPYGPVFLPLTLVPSFLGLAKFLPTLILFKAMNLTFFLLAVYFLNKMNKRWAVIFATHPLVIVEGLINSHNDLIATALAIIGVYYLLKQRNVLSRVWLILSTGIKYTTLPLLLLSKDKKRLNLLAFVGTLAIIVYLSFTLAIQPWYFLPLFIFLPFYEKFLSQLNILFAGLLLSYYPYIAYGGWGEQSNIELKNWIIFGFFALCLVYNSAVRLLYKRPKK